MPVTYTSVAGIAKGVETQIVIYTVSTSTKFKGFLGSGTCESQYIVYIDNVAKYSYRTSPADRNAYLLVPDHDFVTSVIVKVIHYETKAQNFEATIITN